MKLQILAALLAATLVVACDDTTPTTDAAPAADVVADTTPTDAPPDGDQPDTTSVPDVVVDVPTVETDYCADLKAKNACGVTWHEVDNFLVFVPMGTWVTLTCTSKPAIEACRVDVASNSDRFNGITVYGQGLPTETSWYDNGNDATQNDDNWDSRSWLQTTVHGGSCLAVEDIDAGGIPAFREFLLDHDA